MGPKPIKKSGNFYRRRDALLDEADREGEAIRRQLEDPNEVISYPNLDVELTPEETVNAIENFISDHSAGHERRDRMEGRNRENCGRDTETNDALNFVNYLSLPDALRYLAITCRLTRFTINAILAIIRKHSNVYVPKTSRTLLKTPLVGAEIKPVQGGHLWYCGIESVLHNYFENIVPDVNQLTIDVSADGLPLFKSSKKQLIPLQIRVAELTRHPVMVIGCFGGSSKPANLEEFLHPLVTEINHLQQTGLRFGERVVPFHLRAFIADSPMRSFLKGTVNFNGLHGCLKCTAVGTSVRTAKGRKVVIDAVNAPPRTDAGFRSRVYNGHHLGCTPLEEINNFNMIEGVPVGDRLHLIDEGVTKKILNGMIDNSFNREQFIHWLPLQKKVVSAFLVKTRLPFEVHRHMRNLNEICLWKATEFRTFLHYFSALVFKDFMLLQTYNHFLLYFCGVTILSTRAHQQFWPIARQMLDFFVSQFGEVYGVTHLTSNVHNLQHVAGEVERLGALDEFSTYAFENNMRFIKPCVRSGTKIVEQVAGRLTEQRFVQKARHRFIKTYPKLIANGRFRITDDFLLGPQLQNQWFLTKDEKIIKFVEAKKNSPTSFSLFGTEVQDREELFRISLNDNVFVGGVREFSSTKLCIYKIKLNAPSRAVSVPHTNIKCKLVPIFIPKVPLSWNRPQRSPTPDSLALFPLLHTFQS